jgi:hypothetical protein
LANCTDLMANCDWLEDLKGMSSLEKMGYHSLLNNNTDITENVRPLSTSELLNGLVQELLEPRLPIRCVELTFESPILL